MHFVMERGMLLGIKARVEGKLNDNPIPEALSSFGWIAATLGIAYVLFGRRRGWWWGLLPLGYAALIITFTHDIWACMAVFLWWGIIAAGFLVLGGNWWKGFVLVIGAVIPTLVLAPQPQLAFGITFLILTLAILGIRSLSRNGSLKPGEKIV